MKNFALSGAVLLLLARAAYPEIDRGAVLRSVALPGWGQHHLGHGGRGDVFLGIEALTWAGVGLSVLEGSFSRDDYERLAMEEAGIGASGLDGDFLDDIADFGSSAEFNDYIYRLARYYYPDDPLAQQQYYASHAREGGESWAWSSEDAREDFADALRESREWYRRALYVGVFAVVNRAVSAIDAALIGREEPVLYSSVDFPEGADFSSVRLMVGTRF